MITMFAVGTTTAVFALIGLAIGLVVLAVVISLLNGVLRPLRRIQGDLQSARGAPMLERGVPGTDQLGATRRLAESLPDLAVAYLQKLSLPARSEAPAKAAAPAAPAVETRAPAQTQTQAPPADQDDAQLPGWKRYRG